MNIRAVLGFLGRLLLFVALAEVMPTIWCLWYGERRAALAFVIGAALTAAVGFGLKTASRRGGELYRREGILIVVGGWYAARPVVGPAVESFFEAFDGGFIQLFNAEEATNGTEEAFTGLF